MATEGWIKLHRKLLDWGWADDPNMLALWCRILLTATHEAKNWRGINLKPGQVVFGRDEWARKTGISPRSLRTCLERLKSTNELTIETTNRFSILTVVNWKEYQAAGESATSKTTSEPTNKRPTNDQQPTTSKECKNERMKEGREGAPAPDDNLLDSEEPKPAPATTQPKKTSLHPDFKPPEGWRDFAMSKGFNSEEAASMWHKFREHHLANGTVKASWEAAWKVWVMDEHKFQAKG